MKGTIFICAMTIMLLVSGCAYSEKDISGSFLLAKSPDIAEKTNEDLSIIIESLNKTTRENILPTMGPAIDNLSPASPSRVSKTSRLLSAILSKTNTSTSNLATSVIHVTPMPVSTQPSFQIAPSSIRDILLQKLQIWRPIRHNLSVSQPIENAIAVNSTNLGLAFTLSYNQSLINPYGMKTYFRYDNGKIIAYNKRIKNGVSYLLDYSEKDSAPMTMQGNLYSYGGWMIVNSYNSNSVSVTVPHCNFGDYQYCGLISPSTQSFDHITGPEVEYYVNHSLFLNSSIRDLFIEKVVNFDNASLNFLRQSLGFFPPIEKIVVFQLLTSGSSGAGSSGFVIWSRWNQPYSQQLLDGFPQGNTHEFTHVFLYGIPVMRSWFEEGIADFLSRAERNQTQFLYCLEDGWMYSNTLVPYSNFNEQPLADVPFTDPRHRASYYRSGECFWKYIDDNFGRESIITIGAAWDNVRRTQNPKKLYLIKDVINPALNTNLSQLVLQRYNYVEP